MQNYDYVLVYADPSHHRSYRDALPDLDLRLTAAAEEFERRSEDPRSIAVIDVNLCDAEVAAGLKRLLRATNRSSPLIVVADRRNRAAQVRAKAIGASHVVATSLEAEALVRTLCSGTPPTPRYAPERKAFTVQSTARQAAGTLDMLFSNLLTGRRIDPDAVRESGTRIVEAIGASGVGAWLASVRQHHTGTFQHCLLVTGLAIAFGRARRLRAADIQTLATGGLLHDIGKAKIPLAILDKPCGLDPDEFAVMKFHTVYGDSFLRDHTTVSPAIRSLVRHHHEYLDGSGYPDGLKGDAIPELTRMLTIADVMGALVEDRAYRKGLPAAEAYARIVAMAEAGKLDGVLVRAFADVVKAMNA